MTRSSILTAAVPRSRQHGRPLTASSSSLHDGFMISVLVCSLRGSRIVLRRECGMTIGLQRQMDEPAPNPPMNDATLLDYFAGQVLTAKRLAHINFSELGMAQTAAHAYALAHAMLEERRRHVVPIVPEAAPPPLPEQAPPPPRETPRESPPLLPPGVPQYSQTGPRSSADPVRYAPDVYGPPAPSRPPTYSATEKKDEENAPSAKP